MTTEENNRDNNFKYRSIKDVDDLLDSGTILKDITTIDKSNIQNEATKTTTREVEVCLYEYDDGSSDIYSYKLKEFDSDLGKTREEEWKLNGELHRMGNYPAIEYEDQDYTAAYDLSVEEYTHKTSYYVEGVMIEENPYNMDDFEKLKNYIDTAVTYGVGPKTSLYYYNNNGEVDNDYKVVIREGQIKEIPKYEKEFSNDIIFNSKKEAIIYQVSINNIHNFSNDDKRIFSANFQEIISKAIPDKIKQEQANLTIPFIKGISNKSFTQDVSNLVLQKESEPKKDIKESFLQKVKAFCKERDAKQKAPEKSQGMER